MKTHRPLSVIANEILADYRNAGKSVYFGAVPYLHAMQALDQVSDVYGCDPGSQIIAYALSNLTTWRGEKAREIKKELNQILKG